MDDKPQVVLYRTSPGAVTINGTKQGSKLDLLVENMGRLNYGLQMTDPKGLTQVQWNQINFVGNWTVHNIPLNYTAQVSKLKYSPISQYILDRPQFYKGTFQVDALGDSFLVTRGWTKGIVWINGNNLGKYWDTQGPQHTLYVPVSFLRSGQNEIVALELHKPKDPSYSFFFASSPQFSSKEI